MLNGDEKAASRLKRLTEALSHPLRLQILDVLQHGSASPSSIARELGESLGSVSYHVRRLADRGLIVLVGQTPRRGAVEHHYRIREGAYFSQLCVALDHTASAEVAASVEKAVGRVRTVGRARPATLLLLILEDEPGR